MFLQTYAGQPPSMLPSKLIELMGSETYLYLTTTGKDDNIIARVDPRTSSPRRRHHQGRAST